MDGLTYVPVAFAPNYPIALALIVLHGAFIPFIVVSRTAILQRAVPRERAGRAFALVHLTVAGMAALSALLAGAIGDAFGPRNLFLRRGRLRDALRSPGVPAPATPALGLSAAQWRVLPIRTSVSFPS